MEDHLYSAGLKTMLVVLSVNKFLVMMMCNDLMCTYELTRSQLSLAHSVKVKTDMPEKNR